MSLASPALAGDTLPLYHLGSPQRALLLLLLLLSLFSRVRLFVANSLFFSFEMRLFNFTHLTFKEYLSKILCAILA